MELLLIRHALPFRVEGADGPADPCLAPEGVSQAAELAAWLGGEPIAAVISSPLQRARRTAEPLAAACALPLEERDDLAEFDRASSWYVPMEELKAAGDERWNAIIEGRWHDAYGIDFDGFRRDAVSAIESVIADHPGGCAAVVTHGGVINAYVAHVVESGKAGVFAPRYTSITRVLAARSGERTLQSLNETAHLEVAARRRRTEPATVAGR